MPDVLETPSPGPKPPKPAIGLPRPRLARVRRWLRSLREHEKLVDIVKTAAWVVPLTILIWVYAEREQLWRPETPAVVPIEVVSTDPTRVVTLLRPQEPVVLADLEGPRSEIDAIRNEFSRSGGVHALEIPIDTRSTGTIEIRTAMVLSNNWRFMQRGINVLGSQPPNLQIFVDEYVELELPVEIAPAVAPRIAQHGFTPASVKVRAPSHPLRLAQETGLHAYADLAGSGALDTPGTHELSNVRVRVDGLESEHVTISPPTVSAKLEVRQRDERFTIPFMAVYAQGPVSLLKDYRVDCPLGIPNVVVIGPPDKIAQLRAAQEDPNNPELPRPSAVLDIRGEDRPPAGQSVGPTRSRRLRFDLPEGVRVESAQRDVDFKLIERPAEP